MQACALFRAQGVPETAFEPFRCPNCGGRPGIAQMSASARLQLSYRRGAALVGSGRATEKHRPGERAAMPPIVAHAATVARVSRCCVNQSTAAPLATSKPST
jgi:hypothetical protein